MTPEPESQSDSVESVAAREIATTRLIDAPRERVFSAFTDPARLARWWGPKGFTNTFREFDPRPGGTWRFIMHGPDGANYENHSTFLDVVPPEHIVFRHDSAPHFKMTIVLADRDGRTQLSWTQRFDSVEDRDKVARFAVDANEQNLDRLEAELATMA